MPFYPPPPVLPPIHYGRLHLATRYLLSPLAGYTNLPFRRVVRELGGVGLATTDLVNARGLIEGSDLTRQLIKSTPDDSPYSVQIFGGDPHTMCEAAKLLLDHGVDSIDINMGCPVERINKTGAGAKMMCSTTQTVQLVERVVQSVDLPVTVKMRLGWDDNHLTAPLFARRFEDVGVAAIAIHGRTREQGFTGEVNLNGIRDVVAAVRSIPVVGNGDIRSIPDAARMFAETGCTAISIGRGALANPWIFRQLHDWETNAGHYEPPGNFDDRLRLMQKQFAFLVEHVGFPRAAGMFRKTGHWYLKAMRVKAGLRHQFQMANTPAELDAAIAEIAETGPLTGDRTGLLPDMHVSVPNGPVERW